MTNRRWTLLVALCAAGYLAVLSLDTGSRLAIAVDDLGNLASPLVAAACCWAASRRTTGRGRLSWVLFAASASLWASGQLAWCWYEVVQQVPAPFPGLPDIGYVASVGPLLLALFTHPDAPRLVGGRLRLVVEVGLVASSLFAVSWRFVLGPAFRDAGAHGGARLLGIAYPVLDVVVLGVLLLVAARAGSTGRRPFALVAVYVTADVLGHLVYSILVQDGSWQSGNPVDAAWGIGYLALAAGALAEDGTDRPAGEQPVASLRATLLSYLPLGVVLVVAIRDTLVHRPIDQIGRLAGMVIFVSVALRQLLALIENRRLTRGLEATVARRTLALQGLSDRLQQQAWTDPLTGLPNRARLFDRIDAALVEGPVAVALLDLDGFKRINDSLGHAAGDELLTTLSGRLLAALPPGATAARLGGDEFAFLLPDCQEREHAVALAGELLGALSLPVVAGGRSVVLTGSLGICLSVATDTPQSLLRNADVAMYSAKASGKDRVSLFSESMFDAVLAGVALEADLRQALLVGEVVPWFQPVVDIRTGAVRGVEALARWPREGGLVPPSDFVPLAEQSGLVSLLGRQILFAACQAAAGWNRTTELTLSVNLSAVQLASDELVGTVRDALSDSGLMPHRLVLEITETALMQDVEAAGPRLAALRALGIRIALDDFGTGYCSLGYLQSLPVDIVKIDRAFVKEVHLGPRQSALAAAVMTLARSLELDVVAEGIELPEQAERLAELGCGLAQGFLYGPAVPADTLSGFLHNPGEPFVPGQRFAFPSFSPHSL